MTFTDLANGSTLTESCEIRTGDGVCRSDKDSRISRFFVVKS